MTRAVEAEHADLLAGVDLFADIERVTLAKLAAHLQSVPLESGQVLFREGDPGDAFYLVAKGSVGVYVAGRDGLEDQRLCVLGPGDPLGEMALMTNSLRSATIRAETNGEVLRLDRARFLKLVREEPGVALAIAATLSRRLASGAAPPGQTDAAPRDEDAGGLETAIVADAARAPPPGRRTWRPSTAGLGGILAGAVLVGGWVLPAPTGLSVAGWHALVTLIAVVPALALGALPQGVLALLMACVWVLGGVVEAPVALAGFASQSWVLVVAVLVVGSGLASSGLLYRIALWAVTHSRGGFVGQAIALSVAGVVMGPAVPNATGRVTLVAPVVSELVETLGYAPRSRAAAGLAMAAQVGFGQMAAVFLTSSTTAVLVFAVLPAESGVDLNWLSWAFYGAPANALLFVGLIGAVLYFYRPRAGDAGSEAARPKALALQRALLGPPSRKERVAFAVAAALLLGFATQPLHGAHPGWVAVLALAVLAAARLVTRDTLRTVNWSFVLQFGMLASIAVVFRATQVDRWFAQSLAGVVGDLAGEPVVFIAALTVLCFAVSFFLRWPAAAPLITIAIGPVASTAGISALVVGLVAVIACNGFFLPYQSTHYLAMYHGTGEGLFSHAQARPIALAYGVVTLVAMCASVPAWRAMGLL